MYRDGKNEVDFTYVEHVIHGQLLAEKHLQASGGKGVSSGQVCDEIHLLVCMTHSPRNIKYYYVLPSSQYLVILLPQNVEMVIAAGYGGSVNNF